MDLRKSYWRAIAMVIAALIVGSWSSPANAFWDYEKVDSSRPGLTVSLVQSSGGAAVSRIWQTERRNPDGTRRAYTPSWNCNSLADPDCDPTFLKSEIRDMGASINLPSCEMKEAMFCIEAISRIEPDGSVEQAKFSSYSNPDYVVTGSSKYNLPSGSSLPIYEFANAVGQKEIKNLAVKAQLVFDFSPSAQKFEIRKFTLAMTPFELIPNNTCVIRRVPLPEFPENKTSIDDCSFGYVFAQEQSYAAPVSFLESSAFRVKLRLPSDISGWFYGQISDLEIRELSKSKTVNTYEISAKPAKSPRLSHRMLWSEVPDDFVLGGANFQFEKQRGGAAGISASAGNRGAIEWVEILRKFTQDKSSSDPVVWNLSSVENWIVNMGKCKDKYKGFAGFVATNAMAYSGNEPIWNGKNFEFFVGGMHYLSDGVTPHVGSYDLVMRSDLARCLYNLSNTPVSARISVLGEDGKEVVATNLVGEKDGWLKITARGFTFSEKKIQVTVTQPVSLTLRNFTGKSSTISARQKTEIRRAMSRGKNLTSLVCTGSFNKASEKQLAEARARAACKFASSLSPKLKVSISTRQSAAISAGRVQISGN